MGKIVIHYWLRREVPLCHNVAEESRYISMYIDSYSSAEPIEFVAVAV